MLVSILHAPAAFSRFISALPFSRICLLLLGDHPTPVVAEQVLRMLQLGLKSSTSFSRKFELVSGWATLRTVLPYGWSHNVQHAAFDILMGPAGSDQDSQRVVTCPHIMPVILASLQIQLDIVAGGSTDNYHFSGMVHCIIVGMSLQFGFADAVDLVERLLESLIGLHGSSATFRQVFKSHSTTQYLIDAHKSFVAALSHFQEIPASVVRILEKLAHLSLSVALDTSVAGDQKQEVCGCCDGFPSHLII